MGTTRDFCNIWLEVRGIIVPAPVADFLLSYLHWFDDGKSGTCQVEPPLGWDWQDLCTVGYLVANREVLSAQKLIDSLPCPMVMLSSSTLMEGNNNHLKKNPFRKRRSGKKRKQADQSVANHDPSQGDDSSKGDISKCGGDIDVDGGKIEVDFDCIKDDGNKCRGDVDGSKSEDHVDGSRNVCNDTQDDADSNRDVDVDEGTRHDRDGSKLGGDGSTYGGCDNKSAGDGTSDDCGGSKGESDQNSDDSAGNKKGGKGTSRTRMSGSLKKRKEAYAIIHIPTLDRNAQVQKNRLLKYLCSGRWHKMAQH